MLNNIVNFRQPPTPDDLMTYKEFSLKYGIKEGSVRKAQARGGYRRYKRGVWKISDNEAITYWNGVH